MTPSKYQQAIYDFVQNGTGHAVVQARAGSGKTSTIVGICNLLPASAKVLVVAFNKHIATELAGRVPSHVEARTLHSIGFGICKKVGARIDTEKQDKALRSEFGRIVGADTTGKLDSETYLRYVRVASPAGKLVSLAKLSGYGSILPAATEADLLALADRHNAEFPPNGDGALVVPLALSVLNATLDDSGSADFDDMIVLPVKYGAPFPQYDYVLVDESQDLNRVQAAFVRNLLKPTTGRAIFLADPAQAIYAFAGADSESVQNIIESFAATLLPLSICYRCPRAVIREAQKIVPDIEAADGAEEGIVRAVDGDEFDGSAQDGDWVLCRTTAPLVSNALKFLREGRKATVHGRDIGANLTKLAERIAHLHPSESFTSSVAAWDAVEQERLTKRRANAQAVANHEDRVATLVTLSTGGDTLDSFKAAVKSLFSDDVKGVTFATIHRSKGLEVDRVFILRPDLLPHPAAEQEWQIVQESNLRYVAITRAKRELVYVRPPKKEKTAAC